jgi:hypothetical protein
MNMALDALCARFVPLKKQQTNRNSPICTERPFSSSTAIAMGDGDLMRALPMEKD